jgi:hypothetical protein
MRLSHATSCLDCSQFNAAPLDIEAALPGLASLSSAYASVRANDGLCALHERYVAASSVCTQYRTRAGRAAHSASTSTRQS